MKSASGAATIRIIAGTSTSEEQSVWEHVRRLTRLRTELTPLRQGSMINLCVSEQSYGYARRISIEAAVVVLMNNAPEAADVSCDLSPLQPREGASLADRLGAAPELKLRIAGGKVQARFPGRSAGIYVVRQNRLAAKLPVFFNREGADHDP